MVRKTVLDPYIQRRLEKLGRSRLKVGYEEHTVCETKRNADAFESPTLLDDEFRQRGMTMPHHEGICKPERPACNLSALEISASVAAALCDRTLCGRVHHRLQAPCKV